MRKRLTLGQALRLEGWSSRLLAAVALLWFGIAVLNIPLLLILGASTGTWRWGAIADNISAMALAGMVIGYVYWRRRALEVEKVLPPNRHETSADSL